MNENRSALADVLAVALASLLLAGCNSDRQRHAAEARSEAAQELAAEAAAANLAGTTYADQGQPYGCTLDCSGHEAGYKWADENEITDPADCEGNSQSFIEGCEAYAEAYQAAAVGEAEAE